MLLSEQERAVDLFSEHYMDLQGCHLLLKAQTVFFKGLRRVLKEPQASRGGGEQGLIYVAVRYDL